MPTNGTCSWRLTVGLGTLSGAPVLGLERPVFFQVTRLHLGDRFGGSYHLAVEFDLFPSITLLAFGLWYSWPNWVRADNIRALLTHYKLLVVIALMSLPDHSMRKTSNQPPFVVEISTLTPLHHFLPIIL